LEGEVILQCEGEKEKLWQAVGSDHGHGGNNSSKESLVTVRAGWRIGETRLSVQGWIDGLGSGVVLQSFLQLQNLHKLSRKKEKYEISHETCTK